MLPVVMRCLLRFCNAWTVCITLHLPAMTDAIWQRKGQRPSDVAAVKRGLGCMLRTRLGMLILDSL
jgi:hypothetical protein